ncbi:MAG: BACON domain-containing protein [Bryobacteraceae bacterium]
MFAGVVRAQCVFTISPARADVDASANTGVITIMGTPGCPRTAVSNAAFITVTFGQTGTGSGTAGWAVDRNTYPAPRTGAITVAGQTFTITQAGAACQYTLLAATPARFTSSGGAGVITVKTQCSWTASTAEPWIRITSGASGTYDGEVRYTVAANDASRDRTGSIRVGDQSFTITQSGVACVYDVSPVALGLAAAGGTGRVSVATDPRCGWAATTRTPWIQVTSPAVLAMGPGTAEFTVAPNSGAPRTGTVTVANRDVTVAQGEIRLLAVVNAATYAQGAVAPGEIVTIYGAGLGPAALATLQLENGAVSKMLAGTRVLFGGVPAPVIYTSAGQASSVVPYAVSGSTEMQVEYNGARSNTLTLRVTPAEPGIFTLDASGTGQAAALNQDYSVNGAANPAARGTVLMLFATGGGATEPPSADGGVTGAELPRTRLPVGVRIGGVECNVQYAGGAPGLVSGVLQINAEIAAEVTPGDALTVVVRVGDAETRQRATVAVR